MEALASHGEQRACCPIWDCWSGPDGRWPRRQQSDTLKGIGRDETAEQMLDRRTAGQVLRVDAQDREVGVGIRPTTRAANARPSFKRTPIESASSMTWLFVRIAPSLEKITPEPAAGR